MRNILQNILAVIVGLFIGGAANMGIVMLSGRSSHYSRD